MRKKFIVIVDDSATIRRLIQRELEAQGYEVVRRRQADSYLYKAKDQGRNRVVSCLTEGGEA